MTRFLIEVSQTSQALTEKRIQDAVQRMGSHFVTHANWSRENGRCRGVLIVEANDKWGALGVVPPGMRADAHVFALHSSGAETRFSTPPVTRAQRTPVAA